MKVKMMMVLLAITSGNLLANVDMDSPVYFVKHNSALGSTTIEDACPETYASSIELIDEIIRTSDVIVSQDVKNVFMSYVRDAIGLVESPEHNSFTHVCGRLEKAVKQTDKALSNIMKRHTLMDNVEYHLLDKK